jgi:hypothetical protein
MEKLFALALVAGFLLVFGYACQGLIQQNKACSASCRPNTGFVKMGACVCDLTKEIRE